eukprot:s298_g1.t1
MSAVISEMAQVAHAKLKDFAAGKLKETPSPGEGWMILASRAEGLAEATAELLSELAEASPSNAASRSLAEVEAAVQKQKARLEAEVFEDLMHILVQTQVLEITPEGRLGQPLLPDNQRHDLEPGKAFHLDMASALACAFEADGAAAPAASVEAPSPSPMAPEGDLIDLSASELPGDEDLLGGLADSAPPKQADVLAPADEALADLVDPASAKAAFRQALLTFHPDKLPEMPLLARGVTDALVKEIEGRGNVALDLAKGALELKKGMEFKPKKPTEAPVAQFANEAVATAALSDASELVGMLAGVRVMVESHVKPAGKGAEAFWEQLAVNRADLIREHLAVKAGENITSSIEAKGLPGKLGLNINAIVVKLDFSPGEAES